jgi:chromodomain-helicase-DNA-binding protein 1
MPVKEGFGFDHPPLPVIAGASKARVTDSPNLSVTGKDSKGKRRKTPEFTDSEDESAWCVNDGVELTFSESMDEAAVKEALRPAKKHLVSENAIQR